MSQLSTNVLEMKFMQRTKKRLEAKEKKKKEEELRRAYLSSADLEGPSRVVDQTTATTLVVEYVYTKDYEFLEDLSFGRMSFRGYNPQVEKLMQYYRDLKNGTLEDTDSDDEKDVDDEAMTEVLGSSLNRTIASKFQKKAQRDTTLVDESCGDRLKAKRKRQADTEGFGSENPQKSRRGAEYGQV